MEGTLTPNPNNYPSFFSPETGVYSSKHSPRPLPEDPFHDLVSFLFSHQHQGLTALLDSLSGSSISYRQLSAMVKSTASGLQNLGVSRNQVILLLLPNSILYPVLFLGVIYAGAIVTTMNPLSSPEEINNSIQRCRPVMTFTSLESNPKVDILGVMSVLVPEDINFDPKMFSLFNHILSGNRGGFVRPEIRQTDTAAILYSSGTSGPSKGVVLTHKNLIAAVELFVRFEALQYGTEGWKNVYLATLPMSHMYGLSLFAIGLFSLGSTVVVMKGRFGIEQVAVTIDRFKVTHFPVVPPMLGALVRARNVIGYDLKSLKQVSCGAAPLSQKLMQGFLQAFPSVDLIQGYGMTESTAVGTRGFNTDNVKKHSSVGLLAPNMLAKVVDCYNGTCLPPGSSGELWLRGPGVMKGYLNDEKATTSTIDEKGWMRTGDVAYFDEDGYLYILDRLKDIIKYKGYQIAPADLESVMFSHPEIADVGVTFAKDDEAGEIPVAFVVRKPRSELSSDEVIEYVSKQVAPYKKVRKVVFVQSIPRSPTGKILRRLLRNSHGNSRM